MLHIEPFFDSETSTFTYVVADMHTKQCAIIDPVLNYDLYTGRSGTDSADQLIAYIESQQLTTDWILETHIHADHITAARYLQQRLGGKTGIGARIVEVLILWTELFETEDDTPTTGQQFDYLFSEGDTFTLGQYTFRVMHTPGHTPACASYLIDDNVFVGDTLFAPQRGTARCDFPGGDAKTLYHSVQKLYQLPEHTRVYLCHDYPEGNEKPIFQTTIGEQKRHNIMLHSNTSQQEFIQQRSHRDKTLSAPKQIIPAIQTNSRLGDFGKKSIHGKQFIKVPVNIFG